MENILYKKKKSFFFEKNHFSFPFTFPFNEFNHLAHCKKICIFIYPLNLLQTLAAVMLPSVFDKNIAVKVDVIKKITYNLSVIFATKTGNKTATSTFFFQKFKSHFFISI